jgi:RNA polymerase sigma factor (sigma-70 family)
MNPPLPEAETRRIYLDALERAMRHAAVHVSRDEAREIGHHVASALLRRSATGGDMDRSTVLDPVNSIDAFIHRAVVNRLREMFRARKRRETIERSYSEERAAVAPAWVQPGSDLETNELRSALEAAVAALPEVQRQVFLLLRRDQRSYKEVAAQLGIGVGTVHTHLSRANATLRDALAEFRQPDRPSSIGPSGTVCVQR